MPSCSLGDMPAQNIPYLLVLCRSINEHEQIYGVMDIMLITNRENEE